MNDCPKCEYNKNRAARWRAEAYKQAGQDVVELPWVGLTDAQIHNADGYTETREAYRLARAIEQALKEQNA